MKKFLLTLLSAILCLSVFAQDIDPNRLLIIEKSGNYKSYVVDKLDYIEFRNVEGEVAADIEILEVTLEQVLVSITRTQSCQAFKLTCYPSVRIANASDDAIAATVDAEVKDSYWQDFPQAAMSGANLEPKTDYTLVTVGYDSYGTVCDVRKAEFTTPAVPLVGDPQVAVELVDVQKFEFTLKFTPNADVSKYAYVAGAVGELEAQYAQFAPMFGFSNMGDMIAMWGVPCEGETEFTWKDMQPGTDYEVFIQAYDAAGTMADYQVYTLTTESLGGEGEANVTITLGKYELADWWGEKLPSQFITFTPNDQSAAYRFAVYTADQYDPQADAIKADLCTEPPMPIADWFFYEEITTDYQIDPNTECVAIAAAKNITGEWGPITEIRFTTPAEANNPAAAPSKVIKQRLNKEMKQRGVVPAVKQPKLIAL